MNETKNHTLRGVICTTLGGVSWGFSGTCGQYLFSNYEISSMWLTCIRLLIGSIITLLIAFFTHRSQLKDIWKDPKDTFLLIIYGIFGLTLCQYAYMTSISYSNAATTTVLQTLNLVLIMLFTCVQMRRKPRRIESIALLLALFGTYLLATGGNPTQMVISPAGLFWGLGTAVAVAIYTLVPRGLLTRWDRNVIAGFGMLVGGIVLNVYARSWTMEVHLPIQGWLAVAATIVFGTIIAFILFMQGLKDVGAVKSSMLAATEPVAATVFSALWLGTTFTATDLIGFAAIIATIFLLAKE